MKAIFAIALVLGLSGCGHFRSCNCGGEKQAKACCEKKEMDCCKEAKEKGKKCEKC